MFFGSCCHHAVTMRRRHGANHANLVAAGVTRAETSNREGDRLTLAPVKGGEVHLRSCLVAHEVGWAENLVAVLCGAKARTSSASEPKTSTRRPSRRTLSEWFSVAIVVIAAGEPACVSYSATDRAWIALSARSTFSVGC